jgi:hypothetical protein
LNRSEAIPSGLRFLWHEERPTSFKFKETTKRPTTGRAQCSSRGNTKGHVMIFRAVFWIGLVSLLTPHEPDLGLGRPGAGTLQTSPAMIQSAATGLSRMGMDCGSACVGGLGLLSMFHLNADSSVTAGLADVRAQIEQDQRDRAERSKAI